MACVRVLGALCLTALLGASGCGGRSDPLASLDRLDGAEVGDPTREGSCSMPIPIPANQAIATVTGTLPVVGTEEGPCQRDEGPEVVYVLEPSNEVDVTLSVDRQQTDFEPTLSVQRDVCGDPTTPAELCGSDLTDAGPRYFFASPGSTYFVTIDAAADTSGDFAFDVVFGPPDASLCPVHPEVITYMPGGSFSWANDFDEGHGRVSSRCDAPGREDMFRLVAGQPAVVIVDVQGSGGYEPVISIRTGCGTTTERSCADADGEAHASLQHAIEAPGEYFVVIDNGGIAAGGYSLFIDFL